MPNDKTAKFKEYLLTHKKKCVIFIVLSILLLYGIFVLAAGNRYRMVVNYPASMEIGEVELRFGEDFATAESELFKVERLDLLSDHAVLVLKAKEKGTEPVMLRIHLNSGGEEVMRNASMRRLKVGFGKTVFNNQYEYIYIVMSVMALFLAAYYIFLFIETLKKDRYSYNCIFFFAVALFFVLLLTVWTASLVSTAIRMHTAGTDTVNMINQNLMLVVVLLTVPLMFIFAVSVSVSNIVLMHRESFRPTNALGIAVGLAMTVGVLAVVLINNKSRELQSVTLSTIYAVISSLMVFFETILFSSVFCGVYASKFKPEYNKDYIIILGCRVRPDGTLYPLLRGRADKAIEFYKAQLAATGKQAYFVPSGGRGDDEPTSEAEAIKNYLISQGIPEEIILPETRSTTTRENMKFSKEIIDAQKEDAQVVFATTSYHVFRSGIIASEAGIKIDGVGSKTKWYFWPNAFLREVAGLFLNQPKKQIVIMLVISLLAAFGSLAYSLIKPF